VAGSVFKKQKRASSQTMGHPHLWYGREKAESLGYPAAPDVLGEGQEKRKAWGTRQQQNLPLMGESSKGAVLFSVSSSDKVW
jgi:hypothetical protein